MRTEPPAVDGLVASAEVVNFEHTGLKVDRHDLYVAFGLGGDARDCDWGNGEHGNNGDGCAHMGSLSRFLSFDLVLGSPRSVQAIALGFLCDGPALV